MPVHEVVEERSVVPRLSQLDLTLMPFGEERETGGAFTNGVDIESFPGVRVGGGWDLGTSAFLLHVSSSRF